MRLVTLTSMSESPSTSAANFSPTSAGARAILWAQVAKFFLRLGGAVALARLLTPDNYGLHGMASVVYGLLYMARDFGIVTAIQQPGEMTARLARLRKLGIFGGFALAGLGLLLSWPAGLFYHEPRLPAVLATMSLGFIFGGWNAPTVGLLYREHRLTAIAVCDVTALFLSVTAAIIAAWEGFGVWSLVLMALVYELTMLIACQCIHLKITAISTTDEPVEWNKTFGFSANLVASNVANYFTRTGDQIVTGWSAGASLLGIYSRGAQIASLPMQLTIAPFAGWAVASLARLRDSPAAYVDLFRRTLNGLLHVSFAIGALCYAAPDFVVSAFFGARWMASVPILHWLALALAVQPLLFAAGWLLESTGQVQRLMRLTLAGTLLVVGACVMAASQGIEAVAIASSVAILLFGLGGLAYCRDCTPVRGGDMISAAICPLLAHSGWALILLFGRRFHSSAPDGTGWLLIMGCAGLYYGALLLGSAQFRRELFARGFLHSHSYTGSALACRAALATLDIFETDNVIEKNFDKAKRFSLHAEAISRHASVENFRHMGMIWAFDIKMAKPTFAHEFFKASLQHGVLLRPIGNTVYFMPPYVIENDEFAWLVEQTVAVINETCAP